MGKKRLKSAAAPIYFHADVYDREFPSPFLLISLLRSRGSQPRLLCAWITVDDTTFLKYVFNIYNLMKFLLLRDLVSIYASFIQTKGRI